MFLSWLALLFSILGAVTAVDICSDYPKPDPCLPGGEWDPVLNSCSGYDGRSCFQCYSGQFCKTREDTLTCQLSSTGGNPLVIAQFWLLNSTQEPCSTTLAHYRPAYQNPPGVPLPPLEDAIRKLHAISQNVDTSGRQLIGGFGATMMLHATVAALSEMILKNCTSNCPPVVDVMAQPPYYDNYPYIVGIVQTARWNTSADPTSPYTIEILTYPNNPNGVRRNPLVKNPNHVIRDMVYYWPMYTDIDTTISEPIMIFSSSKHEGLAGTRFGWGLYQDSVLAQNVAQVVNVLTLGLSVDVQLRVLASIQAIIGH
ncbi:Tryptophan aminotransferase-related protein 3 [Geodia barretti]|uniref:Tryptophan aminotransferase-related protein 3 n=1 Tax=Geodia barretti TaxID=519541 RepID=A0AA35WDU6_GEOBA|nr:Tryptophan aminotransferase-related protein 3 [Geodia barretti]